MRSVVPEYQPGFKCKIVLPSVTDDDRYRMFSVVVQSLSDDNYFYRFFVAFSLAGESFWDAPYRRHNSGLRLSLYLFPGMPRPVVRNVWFQDFDVQAGLSRLLYRLIAKSQNSLRGHRPFVTISLKAVILSGIDTASFPVFVGKGLHVVGETGNGMKEF